VVKVLCYKLESHWFDRDECVRQLNTTIPSYVWRTEIFRVPLSILQRRKEREGVVPYTLDCKEVCTISLTYASTGAQSSKTNEWVVAFMGPASADQEPAIQRSDTHGDWVSTTICGGRRLRGATRKFRITVNLEGTTVQHYVCRAAAEPNHQPMATNSQVYSIEKPGGKHQFPVQLNWLGTRWFTTSFPQMKDYIGYEWYVHEMCRHCADIVQTLCEHG